MKVAFGRERPDANRGPYAWFQGGRSFVSADTTPAFALAEAVAAGFDHRWEVTVPAYVAATAVGVGRMGRDRHWASDILASAFLGIGTTKLFNALELAPRPLVLLGSVNGERFAPGRHVVPASKAAALRSIDVGR